MPHAAKAPPKANPMHAIERHDRAPYFRLKDQSGERCSLDQYHGRNLVLFFYDHDDSPEAVEGVEAFGHDADRFAALHAEIVGVSADAPRMHHRFSELHHVNFPLLSDRRHKLARALGIYDETRQHVQPTTVLVDADGRVDMIYAGFRPERHAQQVLQHLHDLDRVEQWPAPGSR